MSRSAVVQADEYAKGSTTGGIQEAVDALPRSGGTVLLGPGKHRLRRRVTLRSNVTVRGEGPATVLTRPREIRVDLAQRVAGKQKTITLGKSAGFRIGDEIYIRDDENNGWASRHVVVRNIKGKRLIVDLLWGSPRWNYLPRRHAYAANWFPAFWMDEEENVTVENLTIDGGVKRHKEPRCDFVVSAVHTRGCKDVRVMNVTVRGWYGDGISIQGGQGGQVSGCLVERCRGHGYHPGTNATGSVWTGNIARRNTRDGFFFCLRVTHSVVQGNVFVTNGGHGIGGLSYPDMYNTVVGNVCADNGTNGIEAARSYGNAIQGNVCRNNSRSAPGKHAGIYLMQHRDNAVTGNVLVDDQERHTQTRGLVSVDPVGSNVIEGNLCQPGE
jgi:parallel beta-helix repeat protein